MIYPISYKPYKVAATQKNSNVNNQYSDMVQQKIGFKLHFQYMIVKLVSDRITLEDKKI